MREEEQEYVELGSCERDGFVVEVALFVITVDTESSEHNVGFVDGFLLDDICGGASACALCAPEDCADTRENFADVERLGDVVVGANVEAFDDAVFVGESRAEQDGSFFGGGDVSDASGEVESAELSHHYVDQKEGENFEVVALECFFGTVCTFDLIAFALKVELEDFANGFFVIND